MLKVFTDFNAGTPDGVCWNLVYCGVPLESQMRDLHLTSGDKIILYQDEGDFEVTASLDFRYVDILGRSAWVAVPDWSTIVRK
jgi:hypothetical protein